MYEVFIILINVFEIKMINTKFGPQLQIRKTSKDFQKTHFWKKLKYLYPVQVSLLLQSKAKLF